MEEFNAIEQFIATWWTKLQAFGIIGACEKCLLLINSNASYNIYDPLIRNTE